MKSRKLLYGTLSLAVLFSFIVTSSGVVSAIPASQSTTNNSANSEKTEADKDQLASLREQAKEEVAAQRKNRATIADEDRKTLCDNRRNAIQNKLSAYSKNATIIQDKLDGVYEKLTAYKDVEGVSAKLAALETSEGKMTKAHTAVSDLTKMIDGEKLECGETAKDNAEWLTGVKTAVANARTALRDYRDALKDVYSIVTDEKTISTTSAPNEEKSETVQTTSGTTE